MRIVPDNKASVVEKLSIDDYECCLGSLSPKRIGIRRIGSDLHRLFTYSTEKIILSAFDIKRWIREDGISAYAFGHWKMEFYVHRLEQFQIIVCKIGG